MAEKTYLAYFEAVTTKAPGCIEQHKHPTFNQVFAEQENDYYELDDNALKTALLSREEPRSCVFLGVFDEEQIDLLERSLAAEIAPFSFPCGWWHINFNRKYGKLLSDEIVPIPLDDSPYMRRAFFCIVRYSDLRGIQDRAIRKRFFSKLERKASLLPRDENSDDDLILNSLAEDTQNKTFESWFCHSCDHYALRKDSCCDVTDMLACNAKLWAHLRNNYRSFFLKFQEFAENLKVSSDISESDDTTYSAQSKAKSSKKTVSKTAVTVPGNNPVNEEDKRTDMMLKVQQDAEATPLPDDDKSNDQWITASDLAGQIAKKKSKAPVRIRASKEKPSLHDGEKKPKTPHETARETLNSERKIGKCIWPSDKETAKQNPLCGWARHVRFWRKREDRPHPVFYYRLTTEEGWQEKEKERQRSIEPDAEPTAKSPLPNNS